MHFAQEGDPEANRLVGFIEGATAAQKLGRIALEDTTQERVGAFLESRRPW